MLNLSLLYVYALRISILYIIFSETVRQINFFYIKDQNMLMSILAKYYVNGVILEILSYILKCRAISRATPLIRVRTPVGFLVRWVASCYPCRAMLPIVVPARPRNSAKYADLRIQMAALYRP